MSLHLRDVTEADLPALLSLRSRAFGPLGIGGDTWWERIAAETLGGRWLAVTDADGDLVGAGGSARTSRPGADATCGWGASPASTSSRALAGRVSRQR